MSARRLAPFAPFVLLAYLPALLSSPGRMPADSKLYLYLDPGGFFADAAGSFDPGQFAGWVPHQHIAHLWPSLPWFWSFEAVGVPDWVAHRLWIGTIFLSAGLGVRRAAQHLGVTALGALVAGMLYQLSPYVVPYVSRTSVMLLPWAGLGWILATTVTAARRRTWAASAAVALVVVTVGAVNATALLLVVPVPVLWLVHETERGALPLRSALSVAGRTGALCIAVSAWWIAALLIQARFGAAVLPYSEALADVSAASTSAEVWRGLGYWLFYVRDPAAPATSAAAPYLTSSILIALGFVLPVLCLAGLVWVKWVHRRFATALVAVGGILAVGVHPSDDRAPLVDLLTGDGDQGLVLALRSSTRAIPVMVLGLALAAGALITAVPVPRPRRIAASAFVALSVLGLPVLWTASLVDPAIDRDERPPMAWTDAAATLDDPERRVLVLPGSEFGAYRWGYTVDQPLPGMSDVPVVTRDLLPLGSAPAMDLLYALDDRFQDGVAEPASLAPIARLLGVGTVWLANDLAFDRFRTARPEVVRDLVLSADGVTGSVPFGAPMVNRPDVAMIDGSSIADARIGMPLPPVELVTIDRPGSVVRAAGRTVLVAGSGDGLVDAAAAGLLRPDTVVRYTADGVALDPTVVGRIVTDSNRDRARHWRGSQDTTGYTEAGRPGAELLREPTGDARLPVFSSVDPSTRTTAVQVGPVVATATSYGEPFAYTPEHRPAMAIDGDMTTAWLVGEHGDPVGETIRLTVDAVDRGAVGSVRLVQSPSTGRWITAVDVITTGPGGGRPVRERVELTTASHHRDGQIVLLGDPRDPTAVGVQQIDITIVAVAGDRPGAVGFSEIDLGLGSTLEVVRPPDSGPGTDLPTAYVFTRLRTDPLDRWRSDPEPALVRAWSVPDDHDVRPVYTVRVDARSSDAELAELFGWPVTADRRLIGSLRSVGAAAFDDDPDTAWTSPFDDPSGTFSVRGVDATIDSVTVTQPLTGYSTVVEMVLTSGSDVRRIAIDPDADGVATMRVEPPLDAGDLTIEVTGVTRATTVDRRFGDVVVLPVSISEISFDGVPDITPLAKSSVEVPCVTLGDLDGTPLKATVVIDGTDWLDGGEVEATPCADRFTLKAGEHLLRGASGPWLLDRVVLDDRLTAALDRTGDESARVVVDTLERDRFGGRFRVDCPSGCWFVFGEGFNRGWQATTDGRDLGPAVLVDGGSNGWWIEPGVTEILVEWNPQRFQTAALALSAASTLGALGLVAFGRRRRPAATDGALLDHTPQFSPERDPCVGRGALVVVAWALPAALLVGPGWGLLAGFGGIVAQRYRTLPLAPLCAAATVATVGIGVVALEFRRAPALDLGWPAAFEELHGFGMLAFALLVTSVLTDSVPEPTVGSGTVPDVVTPGEADGTPAGERAGAR